MRPGRTNSFLLAALPYHRHLTHTEKALAVTTLVAHGRRKVAREQYPELWGQDMRAARQVVRQTTRQARFPYRGKAGPPVLSLDHYKWQAASGRRRADDSWLIRRYGLDALRTGTIAPADVMDPPVRPCDSSTPPSASQRSWATASTSPGACSTIRSSN